MTKLLLPSPSLQAALFDLDGTLVRTFIDFPAMRREMKSVSERFGTAGKTAQTDDILEIVHVMAQTLGGAQGESARREAFTILEAIETEGCRHPEKIEGAAELLTCLRGKRGLKIGIITRNARRIAEDLLARMDLPHDALIAREDTTEFKPHPDPIFVTCAYLGVPPEAATMTGDLWTDIASGHAAGVHATIGIQWPHDPPHRFARCQPDFEVSSLMEAARLLTG